MAEFQEVMKQWLRRCEACEKNEPVECGISGYVCEAFRKMQKHIDPEYVERDVMSWAAEYPEPVYPTWFQWLKSIGALPADQTLCHKGLENSIPADIAEKLGIEPKEGT